MKDYQIITDACCDMEPDLLEKYQIAVIPMEVRMNSGEVFLHYPDFRNYSPTDFYKKISDGVISQTSQITPAQFIDFFTPILDEGKDILYISLSSGLSGTYSSALSSISILKEEYPERLICCVDSLGGSGGQGMITLKAAQNRDSGMGLEENASWLTEHRLEAAYYFTVGSLDTLRRGGRVSAASAMIGTALNIKPILFINDEGKLIVHRKVRGRKPSLKMLLELTLKTIQNSEEQTVFISHANCHSEALEFRELVKESIPCKDVIITRVGPVIGSHTGPDLMCLFSWGKGRIPKSV